MPGSHINLTSDNKKNTQIVSYKHKITKKILIFDYHKNEPFTIIL
jgi:hypothetical protein